jgi:hypothetical protein
VAKRHKDGLVIKDLQTNVQLRTYMDTAEQGWDLLKDDIMGMILDPQPVSFSV